MQLQVRLLDCDGGRRVVLVTAREGERFLGSALGEADNAEEAEDRARARLLARLGPAVPVPVGTQPPAPLPPPPAPSAPQSPGALQAPSQAPAPAPAPVPAPATSPPPEEEPQDWSAELTRLDLQVRRLGWDREREALYLQRCFGHPSRDRITAYGDLMAYLQLLEGFEAGCDPATAPVPLRRSDLLRQCDLLLQQLGWDGSRGRRFLEQHLGVSSRQQLRDTDLLRFNMLLEEETLQVSPGGAET
ncbi:hypothetical protein [Synechococcus sp. CCY 9618]|uniref:hypothetical protein n=1 Tax=Synechococcus sp. CCY 9618 TaxID=2815602 RepID=UPI001C21AD60|nr:hypothetical protein [Synechococcus sp. CCY 9618]